MYMKFYPIPSHLTPHPRALESPSLVYLCQLYSFERGEGRPVWLRRFARDLSYLTLPYLTLPYLTLLCLALPCFLSVEGTTSCS
jgi:hypothetical protein